MTPVREAPGHALLRTLRKSEIRQKLSSRKIKEYLELTNKLPKNWENGQILVRPGSILGELWTKLCTIVWILGGTVFKRTDLGLIYQLND